jgi:DNA repair protein RadC
LARYGVLHLRTSELIALLLRTGSSGKSAVDLSDRLLQHYNDDLVKLSQLQLSEIKSNEGFGTASGCALLAAFELGRRVHHSVKTETPLDLKRISDVARLFRKEYGAEAPEKFVAFYINRRYRLLGSKLISQGSASATVVDPRDVFKEALLLNASAVILAHNHPAGDLAPSEHDLKLTCELVEAGQLFRIPVVEHVIVTLDNENGIICNKSKGKQR